MDISAVIQPVLIVLEGINDIEFLVRLSKRLQIERPEIANLALLHAQGRILFVPTGGGNFCEWATRFRALGCREFHLLDREAGTEIERRQLAVRLVNDRSGCRGFLTAKRSLENYLHPKAIAAAGSWQIHVDDDECIGSVLAHHWYELVPQHVAWQLLSRRARGR